MNHCRRQHRPWLFQALILAVPCALIGWPFWLLWHPLGDVIGGVLFAFVLLAYLFTPRRVVYRVEARAIVRRG